MTRAEFNGYLDEWSAAVCDEAQRLFDRGVPADACLKLSIAIWDARMLSARVEPLEMTPWGMMRREDGPV